MDNGSFSVSIVVPSDDAATAPREDGGFVCFAFLDQTSVSASAVQ